MPSPSDQMAARMDQSAFASVPRYLVEDFIELKENHPGDDVTMGDAFDYTDKINAAAFAIADAAADDIN